MTRENKLALVVGFALILFVGILISDHFSIVRNQKAADLRTVSANNTLAVNAGGANLIDLTPREQGPANTPALSPTTIAPSNPGIIDPVQPEQRTMISPEGYTQPQGAEALSHTITADVTPVSDMPAGFVRTAEEPPAIQVKVKHHNVRGGETLFAICREYYGDTQLVKALAKFNDMDDPASLKVGRRLRIPAAEELGGKPVAPATQQATPPANLPIKVVPTTSAVAAKTPPAKVARTTTYTVKPGDSLAQIAQRFLGSKSKWKKLHDMNRDVLPDPDDLKVGMVLKVL